MNMVMKTLERPLSYKKLVKGVAGIHLTKEEHLKKLAPRIKESLVDLDKAIKEMENERLEKEKLET